MKLANAAGMPVEKLFKSLPDRATEAVTSAIEKALESALAAAVFTLRGRHWLSGDRLHKLAVATTGAVGGTFGIASLSIELPLSTVLMLRSIAQIAAAEGEQLDAPEARLACLEVFALGGRGRGDDSVDSGYFAIRAGLARALAEAAEAMAGRGVAARGAPAVVRFITQIASRFGIPLSEKAAAQSIPLLGAVGGASINVLFIAHFQDIARGHFTVRRLERKYGSEAVRAAYGELRLAPRSSS